MASISRRHANDDPLLRAGLRHCITCGRLAYPVDAEWLDHTLILVTYPALCSHHHGPMTAVVDPATLIPMDIDPELYLPRRSCAGRNSRGAACGSRAAPGSQFCAHHRVPQEGTP